MKDVKIEHLSAFSGDLAGPVAQEPRDRRIRQAAEEGAWQAEESGILENVLPLCAGTPMDPGKPGRAVAVH
jgi:hypothetical protein